MSLGQVPGTSTHPVLLYISRNSVNMVGVDVKNATSLLINLHGLLLTDGGITWSYFLHSPADTHGRTFQTALSVKTIGRRTIPSTQLQTWRSYVNAFPFSKNMDIHIHRARSFGHCFVQTNGREYSGGHLRAHKVYCANQWGTGHSLRFDPYSHSECANGTFFFAWPNLSYVLLHRALHRPHDLCEHAAQHTST